MNMNINSYLRNLLSSLERTNRQREEHQKKIANIQETINAVDYFKKINSLGQKSYLHGSAKRRTLIRKPLGLSWDVDLLTIVGEYNESNYNSIIPQPQSVLSNMKSHLNNTYPWSKMDIKQHFPCLSIQYANDLHIELIPAYYVTHSSFSHGEAIFAIPKNWKMWNSTKPWAFDTNLSNTNSYFNGELIRCIKLIKHWNNVNEKIIRSFLLESIIFKSFSREIFFSSASLESRIHRMFLYLHSWIYNLDIFGNFQPTVADDSNLSPDAGYLDQYLLGNSKLSNLQRNIQLAVEYTKGENEGEWGVIFPNL